MILTPSHFLNFLVLTFLLFTSACATSTASTASPAASRPEKKGTELAIPSTTTEIKLEFLGKLEWPASQMFKKTSIGGLSGAAYNPDTQSWVVVSDDRGRKQEPRFYELKITAEPFKAEPLKVHFLHKKGQTRWQPNVLDCESITLLPWANYLISSEGDLNRKPRLGPSLLDVKLDGTVARTFDLPEIMLPEPSGVQTKGIQNNMGPEGLTSSDDHRFLWVAIEGPLVQERQAAPDTIRIVQYEMPEAWIIKPTTQFLYELDGRREGELISVRGVSEIFWVRDQVLWVMERGLEVNLQGLNHDVRIYEVDLAAGHHEVLKKKLILDASKVQKKLPNFEVMVGGPPLADGRKTLVLISDNNFQKSESTQFWLFARNEKVIEKETDKGTEKVGAKQ
ncbi:MAG: esterase-like activity of phytase family protein [Bdellovibrio sp.]|jgi:hypothetical protein